ncbi:MAG: acyl-phosphate glycerol 3-phosphate acyltransferase [Zetaproteobacteria bacterium CG12_big_fil_rev_8_21_14_0_65_54_13]|nr:MAG: acyl-phosphate glycerol 3-phosphate acyltransferase [Zetaproteobacteria bacterium CG12_big_fil_rev_8_21_14_0_65_54_13]PIX53628.1 MAG: acyl-phosphate glycerol 3-phosphate acyltransferase [Zetaproteobacteria bacterium CG_4_10_14_3_um_filter_54_28]PJA27914.1 MAG: acyl-phosphate glycerol 3-phosphate acyltransferase [Zetaproteobacteria bacterium CG_4_9_14_3_um_filter_54_145]
MSLTLTGAVLAAYLLGAIPFGLLLTKVLSNRDPREHGSGNIGATNAMRTGGKLAGALTLLADIIKGVIPVALAIYAGLSELWIGVVAAATFIGHLFPVYLRFKGGKGVATMLGVMLPWQPLVAVIGLLLWFVLMKLSHYVSLASILAALALPLLVGLTGGSIPALIVGMLIASLVTLKHASNIKRLLDGTEPTTAQDRKAQP